MKDLASRHGRIDSVVHCAGVLATLPIQTLRHEHFQSMMQVNVEAAFGLIKGFRQKAVRGTNGAVVLLSSCAGLKGSPGFSLYGATKAALMALVRSSAMELARESIRVNAIAAAIVETEMTRQLWKNLSEDQVEAIRAAHPLGFGKPEDVANAIAFLVGPTSRWITGTTMIVDGGFTA